MAAVVSRTRRRLMLLAFVVVLGFTGFHIVRTVRDAVYWHQHRDEPIESWMSIGFIAHSYHVPPHVLLTAGDAAQYGHHARHHLARAERLGDIIVGAKFDAEDPVDLVIARRQEEDRQIAGRTQPPADLDPVHPRHVDVEDQQIGLIGVDHRDRRLAVGRLERVEPGLIQRKQQQLADMGIVVDDKDGARHGTQDHAPGALVNGSVGAGGGVVGGGGGGSSTAPSQSRVAPAGITVTAAAGRGLATNLVITTDRRIYYVALTSTAQTAMAALSWTYPADQLIALRKAAEQSEAAAPVATGLDVTQLHFNYAISGDQADWRPTRAFDDGRQTFIEFPVDLATGDAPPLFLVDAKGTAQLVNYRVKGRFYIVDRLFDMAELRLGLKHQQVVRVTRTAGQTSPRRAS